MRKLGSESVLSLILNLEPLFLKFWFTYSDFLVNFGGFWEAWGGWWAAFFQVFGASKKGAKFDRILGSIFEDSRAGSTGTAEPV